MQHTGTVTLETERLILRRFTMEDAAAMYSGWASDAEVTRYLTWPAHADIGVTQAILADWTARYAKKDWYQWAIELKQLGQPIGSIAVVDMQELAAKVHIGYCLSRAQWGRGIMTEALRAVIDHMFAAVEAERVEARFDPRNIGSGRVMEKAGMKFEATLERADWNNTGICDATYYRILRSEWTPQPDK